ncbi:hypothetical protein JDV02_009816 [Purpureocillium takamizusanense]|uniref:Uncharacterized protein n=1 Tax=Purpureocillium takamizusanense TaxID=2060973 RepID=A0A9Q8QT91_9HYPO|nr:uncharacterized protein JDV02_009816 [Purpureocillium takamizusanense]UNI24037.1 hypothetical protein JDV02_009816 [Purpureocillium takamizusanense]
MKSGCGADGPAFNASPRKLQKSLASTSRIPSRPFCSKSRLNQPFTVLQAHFNQTTQLNMSGHSNVGTSAVYEAGDQRNVKRSEQDTAVPYEEGKINSHKLTDPKDERSISNRLAAEERQGEKPDDKETAMSKKDPTLPARMHGNEPSKGAKIDAQLQAEDEQRLREKQGK